jgi:G-rich domain on putative tyrosine kinase
MKHEVESNRQLYDAMLQQLKQATFASALRASNIRVVDPAKLPKLAYKPDIPISTAIGVLSGVFLGAAFVIMQERTDRSIQSLGGNSVHPQPSRAGHRPRRKHRRQAAPPLYRRIQTGKGDPPTSECDKDNPSNLPARVDLATWRRKPPSSPSHSARPGSPFFFPAKTAAVLVSW